MSKILKKKCSLADKYRYEHLSRIKAEDYIKELWEYTCVLQKEVSRLQSIVNNKKVNVKENNRLNLKFKLNRILADREKSIRKQENK